MAHGGDSIDIAITERHIKAVEYFLKYCKDGTDLKGALHTLKVHKDILHGLKNRKS